MTRPVTLDGVEHDKHPCMSMPVTKAKMFIAALRMVCPVCQKVDGRKPSYLLRLHVTVAMGPMKVMQGDWTGPFPKDAYGMCYVLQIRCLFTQYSELRAYDAPTAEHTVTMLIELVGRYGIMDRFMTDQGTHFTAEVVRKLLAILDIEDVFSVPHHPQAIGSTERINAELVRHLTALIADKDCSHYWSRLLPMVQRTINNDDLAVGVPAQSLVFGDQARMAPDPLSIIRPVTQTEAITLPAYLQQLMRGQKVIRETQAKHMQQRIDQCVADNPPDDEAFEYEPGMRVLALIDEGPTSKVTPKWRGPFVVKGKLPGEAYRLSRRVGDSSDHDVDVHIERLRPFLESETIGAQYDDEFVRDMDKVKKEPRLQEIVDWVIRPSVPQGQLLMPYKIDPNAFYGHPAKDEPAPSEIDKQSRSRSYHVFKHMRFLCHWKGYDDRKEWTWEPFYAVVNDQAWHTFLLGQPELTKIFRNATHQQLLSCDQMYEHLCPSVAELAKYGKPIWADKARLHQREMAWFKMDGRHQLHMVDAKGEVARYRLRQPNAFLDWEKRFPYAVEPAYGEVFTASIRKDDDAGARAGKGAGGARSRSAGAGAGAGAGSARSRSQSANKTAAESKAKRIRK